MADAPASRDPLAWKQKGFESFPLIIGHICVSHPRLVPPPESRALRDLTRPRGGLMQPRTRGKHRLQGILPDTPLKRSTARSDVLGKRGRRLREALIAGARDPKTRAALAWKTFTRTRPPWERAWTGPVTAPHGLIIDGPLSLIDLVVGTGRPRYGEDAWGSAAR